MSSPMALGFVIAGKSTFRKEGSSAASAAAATIMQPRQEQLQQQRQQQFSKYRLSLPFWWSANNNSNYYYSSVTANHENDKKKQNKRGNKRNGQQHQLQEQDHHDQQLQEQQQYKNNDQNNSEDDEDVKLMEQVERMLQSDYGDFRERQEEALKLKLAEGMHSPDKKWRKRIKKAKRRLKKKQANGELDKQRALQWIRRYYTNVDGLRHVFGTNKNPLWGDLDAETTRKLYKSLLPRALLGLYHLGIVKNVEDLAPLAFEARLAAKKYARERSQVPNRVIAMAYDGFRHWKRYGQFNVEGLSWDQLWEKYEDQIMEELREDAKAKDVTAKICLRILEKSCTTNAQVDKLVLGPPPPPPGAKKAELDASPILEFENDVREMLNANKKTQLSQREFKALRLVVKAKKKLASVAQRVVQQNNN
eukprot:CAMPEP_0118696294 /NCGR_PEP_ID=MMETSP0800-20121206/13752_1 /TAXON_ID=210618 ORGANISM="Striatella unipunctata, Strain CCMP2910" /NCGR_SAMPLE_ID=MMETSP0800 /ASSEMBLY_ACC=CAM_ASM_000638 /LENGTH=419 /DNA_ID=CAMNT_0006595361 /DNA_START=224 /DNA_END=1483 /DNA_ORIENTATION=-